MTLSEVQINKIINQQNLCLKDANVRAMLKNVTASKNSL